MNRIYTFIIGLTLVASCRQDLCDLSYQSDNSAVRVSVDWSQSNIDQANIHNLSVYAYTEGGGEPYVKVSGDVESASLNLPEGSYTLLIFNDVVGDVAGMNFLDSEDLSTFRGEIVEWSDPSDIYYTVEDGELLADALGQLATCVETGLVVTPDMVSCVYCGKIHSEEVLVEVAPTPLTTQCIVTVRFKNLYSARSIQGVIKGFAASAYLATGERLATSDDVTNLYSMEFTTLIYDSDDNLDGVAEAEIATFGKESADDEEYTLEIAVLLNSGEIVTYTRDVTEQVESQDNVEITINLTSQDDLIELPESVGTGFEVEGWGDKEAIQLL